MSINVTVTGNPVSINRGKMVTSDPYHSKTEFEKRRLMRLEQVRQQSKDIAEEVRNKVKKEKKKCLGEIERQGKENLKCWQNKKLLELQHQYKEALRDIGMGHREAAELDDETEIMHEQKDANEKNAKRRGKAAATKMQVEKNEENMKKAIPIQKKKLVRDIENTRSTLVSNLKKKSDSICDKKCNKRRRASADINITIPSDSDSSDEVAQETNVDVNSDIHSMPSIPEEHEENHEEDSSSSSCDCTKAKECELNLAEDTSRNLQQYSKDSKEDLYRQQVMRSDRSQPYCKMMENHKNVIENFRERTCQNNDIVSEDTRISDRIKRREMMASQPDYCDTAIPVSSVASTESSTRIQEIITHREREPGRPDVYTIPESIKPMQKGSQNKVSNASDRLGNPVMKTDRINDRSGSTLNKEQMSSDKNYMEQYKNLFGKRLSEKEMDKLKQFVDNMDKSGTSSKTPSLQSPRNRSKAATARSSNKKDINVQQQVPVRDTEEIPSKPPVKLKGVKVKDKLSEKSSKTTMSTVDTSKVHFYDHRNRFGTDREIPQSVHVEKIDSSSVEVIPNLISEAEIAEKMRQRDKEAQIRGRKALEKEKVQRDYEEMMKKLPVLQKIERISEISKDKPEYHMSEERLQELQRKRQNELENVFAREFPNLKPAIVTLPTTTKNDPAHIQHPIQTEKAEEPTETVNVAKWDVDYDSPKMFSAKEVREIVNAFTGQKTDDRRRKLKDLIRSLKMQEEQLLNEIRNLPQDDSTQKLVDDLSYFIADGKKRKEERKRRREEAESSTESLSSSDRHRRKHRSKASPRKKVKTKSRKVLILQNTSTQTTPKPIREKHVTANLDNESSDVPTCEKLHAPCDCDVKLKKNEKKDICQKEHTPCFCNKEVIKETNSDELCQILIKINDEDEVPEVVVTAKDSEKKLSPRKKKSPERKVQMRSVSTETEAEKPPKKTLQATVCTPQVCVKKVEKKSKEPKARSWKEQLSRNSMSTSSTSYLSPPEFSKTKPSPAGSSFYDSTLKPNATSDTRFSFSQSSRSNKSIDPRLLNYIRKLLSMSRISIDDLAASSSDVATPSQSVIDIESNNPPLAQLQNIIKYFNIQASDIARELSYSSDGDNTSARTSGSARGRSRIEERSSRSVIPEKDATSDSKESLMNQYADITDSCCKRIANLAAMIQKLREEKVKILQGQPVAEDGKSPASSEKDYSTAYMDLPHTSAKFDKSKECSKHSSTPSWDDDELTKKLLEVDMNLANKLSKFPANGDGSEDSARSRQNDRKTPSPFPEDDMDSADREFYERLKRLRDTNIPPTYQTPPNTPTKDSSAEPSVPFISFLDNIPKLPKLEPLPPESASSSSASSSRKHPPPSKGLVVARKFNENISLVPHELSTIVEADSVVSTRVTPNTSKFSPGKEKEVVAKRAESRRKSSGSSTDRSVPEISPEISVEVQKKPCNDDTCTVMKSKDIPPLVCPSESCISSSSKSPLAKLSSSSGDDIETMESMLKNIGMEWAIPTLHKTQEALALTSSSSSSDLSKSKATKSLSISEVSLRDFLRRQMLGRVSSSSLRIDASPSSLLEFSDLSTIQGNSSVEKVKQRTSTPVMHSKGEKSKSSEKQAYFTEESDISSVKGSGKGSGKVSFHSLSEDRSVSPNK